MKAHVGMMVVVRDKVSNCTDLHPAVINRAWSPDAEIGGQGNHAAVNLTVFPDCGQPYSLTSVYIMDRDYGEQRSCWPAWPVGA